MARATRDLRTFIKVHDGLPDHPKVKHLSDKAFRLLISTWCYCSEYLTDGFVTEREWSTRATPKARRELLDAGLAVPVEGGVRMHDYTDHQRTKAEADELSAKRAQAGRKGGRNSKPPASKPEASALPVAKQVASDLPSKTEAEGREGTSYLPERETLRFAQGSVAESDGGAVPAPSGTAQTLIAEWIDHRGEDRPNSRLIGQTSRELKTLLDDGVPFDQVRRGLVAWDERRLHPGTLASVVDEMRPGNPVRRTPMGGGTNDDRARQVFANSRARAEAAATTQPGLRAIGDGR